MQILPVVAIGLSITYDKVAYINQKNANAWFNITLKFPFEYESKTVVYTNATLNLPEFSFGEEVKICSWLFLGINGAWFLMALALLVAYITVHGSEKMEKIVTLVKLIIL